jgi:hypothetical protein
MNNSSGSDSFSDSGSDDYNGHRTDLKVMRIDSKY